MGCLTSEETKIKINTIKCRLRKESWTQYSKKKIQYQQQIVKLQKYIYAKLIKNETSQKAENQDTNIWIEANFFFRATKRTRIEGVSKPGTKNIST